jgi:hypothetical protein
MQVASIVLKKVWLGSHIKKARSIIVLGAVGIVCLDLILEVKLLPTFYTGIPLPFKSGINPIGGILLPATFFNVLLIVANIFAFAYILHKAGFELGLIPKTRNDWLDVIVFLIFLISGMGIWYTPIFLLAFLVSGLVLVTLQLS